MTQQEWEEKIEPTVEAAEDVQTSLSTLIGKLFDGPGSVPDARAQLQNVLADLKELQDKLDGLDRETPCPVP